MSTYLLAWAVGEFDFIQAVTKGKKRLNVILKSRLRKD